ncbi:MAG TPA: TonB-dependent receptor, partial [Candidatus Limnocylindria bacterium]|nr:TonB-dependent receptor [Candidatus Limnocylindria bacterium]
SSAGTVGLYNDETPYGYAVMTKGANLDVERLEVVKGPVGTLYGRNSTGGAINTIARKPTEVFDAGLTTTLSRFDTLQVQGTVGGPLTDGVRARLALGATQSWKGWQYSNTRPDDTLGELEKQSGRAIVDWDATDRVLVRFTLSGWRDRSDSQAPYALELRPHNPFTGTISLPGFAAILTGSAPLPPATETAIDALLAPFSDVVLLGTVPPEVANYPYIPDNDDPRRADWVPGQDWSLNEQYWSGAARIEWTVSEATQVTGLLSYGQFTADHSTVPQSAEDTQIADAVNDADLKTVAAELRALTALSDRVSLLVGISALYDDTYEANTVDVDNDSFNFGPPVIGNPTDTPILFSQGRIISTNEAWSAGVFGSVEWRFAEDWKFTQGLRYTREKRDHTGCSEETTESRGYVGLVTLLNIVSLINGGPGGIQKGECFNMDDSGNPGVFEDSLREDNVSIRSVVDWSVTDDLLLYAGFTRGYKSGVFPNLNAINNFNLQAAKQEKLDDYEIGAKGRFLERRVSVEAGAFYYDYHDKQLLTYLRDPLFGPLSVFRNAPRSRVYGAELNVRLMPVEGLQLAAAGAWVDTKIEEFRGTTANGTDNDFAGRPFNYSPKWSATVLADYARPVSARLSASIGGDVSYKGKTNATLEGDPAFEIESHALLGAQVRLYASNGRWGLTAFGRNLTDELYKTGVFRAADVIEATAGFPRTYGVTLDLHFD